MKNELNEFLGKHRKQFEKSALTESNSPANPMELFNVWLKEAIDHQLTEAYAMVLATCVDNKPSQRVVYVREVHSDGLVFFTNYLSKKGVEIKQNPNGSLCFFWAEIERQIRLEGTIDFAEKNISDNYFNARPRNSKIGSWASEQSKLIESRSVLDDRMNEYESKFPNEVPRPDHWGGYKFTPTYFEFWQGRPSRLHDRICYQIENGVWKKFRIAP